MPKFYVDVKVFVGVEVEAASEDDARAVADAFVENALSITSCGVQGYNAGLDDPIGTVVPADYTPAVDGTSYVEEAVA